MARFDLSGRQLHPPPTHKLFLNCGNAHDDTLVRSEYVK